METIEFFGWWVAGTGGLFVLLFPLSRCLGSRLPRVFQVLWLVFFLKLLVPVGLWTPFPPVSSVATGLSTDLSPAGALPSVSGGAVGSNGAIESAPATHRQEDFVPSVVFLAWAVWGLGALLSGLRSIRDYRRTLRAKVRGPMAVGLFRPRVLLPADFDLRFTPLERELILAHERAHLRAGDPVWFWVVQAVACLLWWFPLVWWARDEYLAVSELACDAATLGTRTQDDARVYGQLMVRLASGEPRAGAAFAGTFAGLKRRLTAVVRPVLWKGPWTVVLLLVSVAGLGALSLTPLQADGVWPLPSGEDPPQALLPVEALDQLPEVNQMAHPDFGPGLLVWPLDTDQSWQTSGFGMATHPFTGRAFFHKGVDRAARLETSVRTIAAGFVTQVDYEPLGYGYYVDVDHGNGRTSRYAHLSRSLVQIGQTLRPGEVLGAVGASGLATGPHLHWEIRINGQLVDPMRLNYAHP